MKVWLDNLVAARITAEARRYFPLETGGVLLGWRDGADRTAVDAIGPGPGALHGRKLFLPDHAWQVAEIRRAFALSGGDLDYLGDWHSHPAGVTAMSDQDARTLNRMCRKVRGSVMLIAAGAEGTWEFGAWTLERTRRFGYGPAAPRQILTFDAPQSWPRYDCGVLALDEVDRNRGKPSPAPEPRFGTSSAS